MHMCDGEYKCIPVCWVHECAYFSVLSILICISVCWVYECKFQCVQCMNVYISSCWEYEYICLGL